MPRKKCFKCNKNKPLSDYYKHKEMGDGHLNKCKECTKKDATDHRWNNVEKIRTYDRQRGNLPHRIKARASNTKAWRKKFPKRYEAHKLLNNAVRDGKIRKPLRCSVCKKKPLQMEGHHDDYSKPLIVTWLCACCHRQLHRDLRIV